MNYTKILYSFDPELMSTICCPFLVLIQLTMREYFTGYFCKCSLFSRLKIFPIDRIILIIM